MMFQEPLLDRVRELIPHPCWYFSGAQISKVIVVSCPHLLSPGQPFPEMLGHVREDGTLGLKAPLANPLVADWRFMGGALVSMWVTIRQSG